MGALYFNFYLYLLKLVALPEFAGYMDTSNIPSHMKPEIPSTEI